MVDEVEIKITADASKAQKALRDTDFYIKALQEDTELLKDLQVEYKEALAETGGKLTGNALKLHEQILGIKASIAKSERAIEKAGKGQVKNTQKMFRFMTGGKRALLGAGMIGASAYALDKIKDKIINAAHEVRSEYLSSISTGLSGSEYSRMASGMSSMGVDKGNLNAVLSNINSNLLSLKLGIGKDPSAFLTALNRMGISLRSSTGGMKTQKELLSDIQAWVKTQDKDVALEILGGLGFTADLIDEMHDGNVLAETSLGQTEEQIKRLNELSKATSKLTATFDDGVKSLAATYSPLLMDLINTMTSMIRPLDSIDEAANGLIGVLSYDAKKDPISQSLYKTLTDFQSGKITRDIAQAQMSQFYGRELTPEEKDLFSNPERMKKYVKTLEDETEQRFLYLDKAKRLQGEGKKSEAERARKTAQAFEDMITSGTFLKTQEEYEAWKTRDSKMSKLASLRNELATAKGVNKREKLLSEINRLENDLGIKQTRLPQKYTDKYGTNFEALNISDMTVPAQTASSMNGGGIGKLEQNADMVINITGDESTAKQIGQEVGNAVFNAFQASAQQIVGGN